MTGNRPGRIWGLVAIQAARRGGRVSAADACTAAVAAVDVTGGWLTAASDGEAGHLMRITDVVSEQLAEFQLTLGEGPSLDASASGGPAHVLLAWQHRSGGLASRVGDGAAHGSPPYVRERLPFRTP
jgi:hypothetical protein